MNSRQSNGGEQPQQQTDSRRVNPRHQTRSLSVDIDTLDGQRFHGISRDVSICGASFIITSNLEQVSHLRVGMEVGVCTTTARDLRAEINSVRQVAADDSRPLIGIKLLHNQKWLKDDERDLSALVVEA